MNWYAADLHIHTLLSPCAEVEMIPSLIIAAAEMVGLDMIAITDHNSCENAGAVMAAAEGTGIKVIPGIEVQSIEDVHLLCLFDELDQALGLQGTVYESLPQITGARKTYDEQMMVDSNDEFLGYCERPISLPTNMGIEEIWNRVDALGGMIIPSHIDKPGTGICGVLGMLPESPSFEGVEISANISLDDARTRCMGVGSLPIFRDSDAHWLAAIGERRTRLYIEHRSVDEIRMACRGADGRRVESA